MFSLTPGRVGLSISAMVLTPVPSVFAVLLPLMIWEAPNGTLINWFGPGLFLSLLSGALVGFPAMLLLGIPAHAILYSQRRHGWLPYCFAGLIAGVLSIFLLSALDGRMYDYLLWLGALVGVLNALLFWLIRRPDRDAANPPTSPS